MTSPAPERKDTIAAHWKCLAACTLMSMCPFQYGVDFGIIGSLQAMRGFLQVCFTENVKRWETKCCQVFGEVDPESPIGYNISPGRQQLISSLMILGAFISSTAAGTSLNNPRKWELVRTGN
jgi:SP family sugar:H+ symporter-like MFS transporter